MEGILVTTPLLVPEPSIVAEDVLSIASTDVSSGENETVDREVPGRNLGVLDGIAIVLGLQIGSGIFSSPSLVVQKTGSEYVALLVWCIAGMMAWACAACYIELGTRLPFNGGPQEYLAYCFNDLFGFLASWACIFTVKPCSAAILALVISDYVCDALHLERGPLDFIRTLTAVGVIGLVTLINCAGNRQSNTVTKALLACKIFGVGFIIMMGLAVQVLPGSFLPPVSPGISSLSEPALGNYTDATLSAMWAYSGWETLAFVGGELKNPSRNIGLVINTSMLLVILLFILANLAYFSALTFAEIINSTTIGLTFSQHFLGRFGGVMYSLIVCLSCLGTLNIKFFTAGRLTQAAADRKWLLPLIKTVRRDSIERIDEEMEADPPSHRLNFLCHPMKFGDGSIPFSAIIFNSLLAGIYVLVGDFGSLIIFIGIVEYTVVFVTVLGLITSRFHQNSTNHNANYVVFKVPCLLIFVAAAATGLVVSISIVRHPFSGVGFIVFCVISAIIFRYIIQN